MRILSPSDGCVPFTEIQHAVAATAPRARLMLEEGTDTEWEQIVLLHPKGLEIAVVERFPVEIDSIASSEIEEFRDEIAHCSPTSAVRWLDQYFSRVRTIYMFQILSGTEARKGWDILTALKDAIWERATGIFQADLEGFSNDEGFHILWQFSDTVRGKWWMGVLQNEKWVHFRMDLGKPEHREAFLRGEVPRKVKFA